MAQPECSKDSPGLKTDGFVQQIKAKMPENLSFVHEIAELLELSYDSTYRRNRGEKELSLDELYRLSYRVPNTAIIQI